MNARSAPAITQHQGYKAPGTTQRTPRKENDNRQTLRESPSKDQVIPKQQKKPFVPSWNTRPLGDQETPEKSARGYSERVRCEPAKHQQIGSAEPSQNPQEAGHATTRGLNCYEAARLRPSEETSESQRLVNLASTSRHTSESPDIQGHRLATHGVPSTANQRRSKKQRRALKSSTTDNLLQEHDGHPALQESALSRFEHLMATFKRASRDMTEEELEELQKGAKKRGAEVMPSLSVMRQALEAAMTYSELGITKTPFDTETWQSWDVRRLGIG